jgi:hypothetical protein
MSAAKTTPVPAHLGAGRPLSSRPTGPGTAFANFLIDFLPHTKMTNEEISSKLGYSRPNIVSMWKTAKTKVTLDAVWRLAELMHVDPAYMLTLYFEQYVGTMDGGTDHFADLVKMMARVTTPEEWEIIRTVREVRKYNSLPLKGDQKSALKKLFAVMGVKEEGPLREIELTFAKSGDRRTFSRRGQARDMSITEIEEAASKKLAAKGATVKAGKRATVTA